LRAIAPANLCTTRSCRVWPAKGRRAFLNPPHQVIDYYRLIIFFPKILAIFTGMGLGQATTATKLINTIIHREMAA
jgi:hypothetical protein